MPCLQQLSSKDWPLLQPLAEEDPHAWSEKLWQASLQTDEVWGLVTDEGQLAGVLVLGWGYREAEILYVLVAEARRRQGFAQQLVDKARQRAQEETAERLLLEVRASNRPAIRLYEQQGFQQDGVRKNYYASQASPTGKEDAILMSLKL
ncbi:ribosomal protein S18-alanine N-acetyltransferase [Marinospirillum perlucidum]|uniref:ribosomal protein S18-alanine N-acetyltransferase n=1 Tax=Marinospirillum perlucidum TaxID=1982602 RepID=UPI000DF318BB|nr:ribosomal protein S18-alanine N-acetyltransferase [Marinospirillum perlucidum]